VIQVALANEQSLFDVDEAALQRAVSGVFEDAQIARATISLAVVDDPTIQSLHRRYLDLDTPTDVLSFLLEQTDQQLEGEVVVSAETAQRVAPRYGWSAQCELTLYAIHGALHLVGYNDLEPDDRERMRAAEQRILARCGIRRPSGSGMPAGGEGVDPSAAAASRDGTPPESNRGAPSP
jgi:probable rRNA maturation factor